MTQVGSTGRRRQPPPNHGHHRSHDHRHHHRHRQARSGRLLGEASAVTFHFVWVHQEKFNQPYVEAMGKFWRACNIGRNNLTEDSKSKLRQAGAVELPR